MNEEQVVQPEQELPSADALPEPTLEQRVATLEAIVQHYDAKFQEIADVAFIDLRRLEDSCRGALADLGANVKRHF